MSTRRFNYTQALNLARILFFCLCLVVASTTPTCARPLSLEDVLDLEYPGDGAISVRGDAAFLIQRYLNPSSTLTGKRRMVNNATLWLHRSKGQTISLGEGAQFVEFSPDGRWLVTAVPHRDGHRFRVWDLENDTYHDFGFNNLGYPKASWSADSRLLYIDDKPWPKNTPQILDTRDKVGSPSQQLMIYDPSSQKMEFLDDGTFQDDLASSPTQPLVSWLKIGDFPPLQQIKGWQNWSLQLTVMNLKTGDRSIQVFQPLLNDWLTLRWSASGEGLYAKGRGEMFLVTPAVAEAVGQFGPVYEPPRNPLKLEKTFWRVSLSGDVLWENKESLKEVEIGAVREITGPDGLKHWLLLPSEQRFPKPANGYPVVCWVYPGTVYEERPLAFSGLGDMEWGTYEPALFASKGYAVFLPSVVPEESAGNSSVGVASVNYEPAAELIASFKRALRALTDTGLVDASRVAVTGHSGGGGLSYEIVASNAPIKTGIALSGYSDRATFYLTFPPELAQAHPINSMIWQHIYFNWGEPGQGSMGSPPWVHPDRWTRNSAVYRADQVESPLMMVTGSTDSVAAEAMFTALLRQNKTAKFLRFSDEQHYVVGRDNTVRLWTEMFKWLDETL